MFFLLLFYYFTFLFSLCDILIVSAVVIFALFLNVFQMTSLKLTNHVILQSHGSVCMLGEYVISNTVHSEEESKVLP